MQQIPLGSKVKSLGINRANVADGQVGRAVLIDPQPRFKYIAFDEELKRRVEVTQDMVIKYGLSPITYYFYLIARLNTDLNGNVVGSKWVVEYIQLSENVNNEFADAVNEQGGQFTQLRLNKVTKKGQNGKDFGYIRPIPSNQQVDQEIIDSINQLRQEPGAIDAMWVLVDRASSITPKQYEELRNNPQQIQSGQQPAQIAESARPQISSPMAPSMSPTVEGFGEGFDSGEDFNDFK